MASEEFSNSLWRGWDDLFLNTVSISKVSHTFSHWEPLCHCNTLFPKCWLQLHNSKLLVGILVNNWFESRVNSLWHVGRLWL